VSGHRIGSWLPWYRGKKEQPMEVETQALVQFVEEEMFQSDYSLALDVHSGFGMRDRLWYPYASSARPFKKQSDVDLFRSRLDSALPFHVYKIEPQADSYLLHGDPWDYLLEKHEQKYPSGEKIFVPWCLEMGSWTWLKKNPMQLFQRSGLFN